MAKKSKREQFTQNRKVFEDRAEQMRQSDEKSLSLLAAGVAHEFNNLLGAAHGHAEWALSSGKSEDMRVALETVILVCQRSSQLTKALQNFAQPKEEAWEELSFERVIEEALQILGPELDKKKIVVEQRLHSVSIHANASELLEVVVNLIKNAIETEYEATPRIVLEMTRNDSFLDFRVTDNGAGVDDAFHEAIFLPFWTSKGVLRNVHEKGDAAPSGKGSGLGLFWARKILREHGGDLQLEQSSPGLTTFSLRIPLQKTK